VNPTIQVRLPPCALEITVARLTRANHATVTFTATPQAPATDGSITVQLSNIPTDIRRGVWRLQLESDCGCYETDVSIDLCGAPQLVNTHTPTQDTQSSIECCEPELQPEWGTPPVIASFTLSILEDEFVATLDEPPPNSLTLTYDAQADTITFVGVPLPAKTVSLTNSSGVVIAMGTTPVMNDVPLLRCTRFWLIFNTIPLPGP